MKPSGPWPVAPGRLATTWLALLMGLAAVPATASAQAYNVPLKDPEARGAGDADQVAVHCLAGADPRSSACAAAERMLTIPGLPQHARLGLRLSAARHATSTGRHEAALDHALAALALADSPDHRGAALTALSAGLESAGDARVASFFSSLGMVALSAEQAPRHESSGLPVDTKRAFRQFAAQLATAGNADAALAAMALLKHHEQSEFSGQRLPLPAAGLSLAEQPLSELWRDVETPRRPGVQARGGLPAAGEPAPDNAAEARFALKAREAIDRMRKAPYPGVAAAQPRTLGLGPTPQSLQVHMIQREHDLILLMRQPGGATRVQAVAAGRQQVAAEVAQALSTVTVGGPGTARLQALYRRVGQPIAEAAEQSGTTRLSIIADGALRYLPFAALHDGRHYLGERFTVVHHASGNGPALAPAALSQHSRQVKALGVTRAVGGMPALPGVAREMCSIVAGPVHGLVEPDCAPSGSIVNAAWQGEGWVDDRFTAERLARASRAAAKGALLHIGTHFDIRPGHMARSALLLGDGSRFTLEAMGRLDFSGYDLVTLSACETGLGGADGDEVEGLFATLLRRGARAVLASLWRVDDLSTAALMRHFYAELALHGQAPRALQTAQAAVRSTPGWGAPRHWAGFQLTVGP